MSLALSLDGEVERGLLEVVCRLHDLAGADAARQGKLADGLLLRDEPPAGIEFDFGFPVDRLVGNGAVGKDKKVLVPGVLEEVEESLLLEEAGDENQVGLAVLDALPPLLVAFREPEFVSIRGDIVVLEDLPDDLDDGFLLEDAAVLVEHREPDRGHHFCLVQIKPAVFPGEHELTDDAVKISIPAVAHHGQEARLLDHVRGLDLILADQRETDIERRRDLLRGMEALDGDPVVCARYAELDLALLQRIGNRSMSAMIIPSYDHFPRITTASCISNDQPDRRRNCYCPTATCCICSPDRYFVEALHRKSLEPRSSAIFSFLLRQVLSSWSGNGLY